MCMHDHHFGFTGSLLVFDTLIKTYCIDRVLR
jgi:hypothetical protein